MALLQILRTRNASLRQRSVPSLLRRLPAGDWGSYLFFAALLGCTFVV